MSQLCIHRPCPHSYLENVSMQGVLEGFREMTPGGGWDRGSEPLTQPSLPRGLPPTPSLRGPLIFS